MSMPFRVPHIMKKHLSNKSPANMLFFDTETHDLPGYKDKNISRQVLNFGYCWHTRYKDGVKVKDKWTRFDDTTSFWNAIKAATDDKAPLYCFAHNLGFDLTILDFWAWSDDQDYKVSYFVDSDPPTFISGMLNKRKVIFIDTLNYWRQSLEAIGKSIGVFKLPRPTSESTKTYWENYAKQDVIVLEAAVRSLIDYLKLNDLGQFGLSAASLAMSSFKHRFMKHQIYIHDNRNAMMTERASYFGGLCDCFYVGKVSNKTLYKLDVNSMYPFCMLGKFPVKLTHYSIDPAISIVKKEIEKFGAVAKVKIDARRHTYPVRYKDRLCYCNGVFDTYLVGPELRRAIYNGDISRIYSINYYDMQPIFRDYVNFFWAERQRAKKEGNDVEQYFIKIFMNSLYGKFGQLGYDSCILTTDCLKEIYRTNGKNMPGCYEDLTPHLNNVLSETNWQPLGLGKTLTLRRINNHVKVKVPNGEHNESFPAIASYVTAYARTYLLQLIADAGPRQCYYVDTDSLVVSKHGLDAIERRGHLDNSVLGKLKLEGQSKNSYFNAPKDYMFDGKVVMKGVRRNAVKITENTFEQVQFEGIKSVLRRGAEAYIDVKTVRKTLKRTYNKGKIGSTGWVEPFTLP